MTFKGENIGDRPTFEQVEIYIAEKGFYFDAEEFYKKYERKKWLTTKGQPIKSLEAVCDAYNGIFVAKQRKLQRRADKKKVKQKLGVIKSENQRPSKFIRYADQMNDERWRAFRWFVMAVRGRKCEICGSEEHLQVHHLEYMDNRKAWEYTVNQVVVVCRDCHAKIHKLKK